jgi:hypothetical protein
MFGSLVVALPTPHEGGALVLRHQGQEWTFDSAAMLSVALPCSIAYVTFFSDVEHEVLPVTSGHRVTLTYNLYFNEDKRRSAKDLVSKMPSFPQQENEKVFLRAFKALLDDPNFLPQGGTLGFGLQHVYQLGDTLKHVYGLLKGSDAVVYQTMCALGFEPVLYFHYVENKKKNDGVLVDEVLDCERAGEFDDLRGMLQRFGGIDDQQVMWVTPVTTLTRRKNAYAVYGNEASVGLAYGDVCLIVRIGEVGHRMDYPKAAEVKERALERIERIRMQRYY